MHHEKTAVNWEAVGAVGEILGAIGVILTLVYLSIQVRQSTKASRANTAQQFSTNWITLNLAYAHDTERLAVLLSDPDITDIERQRSMAFWRALTQQWSNSYYQYRHGNLDDELFTHTKREIKAYLSDPLLREHLEILLWGQEAYLPNDAFGALVKDIIAEVDGADA